MYHLTIFTDEPEVHLYPVSDVQVGAAGCDEAGFRQYIEEALKDPFARFVGLGDNTDTMSPSNRRLLDVAETEGRLYDTSREALTYGAFRVRDRFLELVEGTQGKWDFMLQGHHKYDYKVRNSDNTWQVRTTDHDIAEALGTVYLGAPGTDLPLARIQYRFPPKVRGKKRPTYNVLAFHGRGNGQALGAPLAEMDLHMRTHTVDLALIAHHHKLVTGRYSKMEEDASSSTLLNAVDTAIVATGSWLKNLIPNHETYAESMRPLALGGAMVNIKSYGDGTFRTRVTI
jgi:hypothetical protein